MEEYNLEVRMWKKRLKQRSICFALITASSLSAWLMGCGNSTTTAAATTSVNGNAMLGPISGATVTAYPVLSTNGSLDTSHPLATATTDSSGNYTLAVPNASIPSGPMGVQMSGGIYKEESSGQTVTLSGKTYTTLLSSVTAGKPANAAVGPLPDMAFQQFQSQMKSGVPANTTMAELATNANYQVSQAFGLPDVVGIIPANTYASIPNDATGQYALVMAAISKAAQSAGTDSTAIAAAYAKSFVQNGNLASLGSSISVTNASGTTVNVTPPTMTSLSTTVSQIGSGAVALAGVTPPSGFTPPTFNALPPAVAPSTYVPGAPIAPTITTGGTPAGATPPPAISCTVNSVVGSLTINAGGQKQCTDYVGSNFTAAQLQSMCQSQGTSCSFSTQTCNNVNATGYVGGCDNTGGGQIVRYYTGYTAQQVTSVCNSSQPPCANGT